MGCTTSSQTAPSLPYSRSIASKGMSNSRLATAERYNAPQATISKNFYTKTTRYTIKYAFVSQRGYYPDALAKPNQDAYCICERVLDSENTAFFGVFDGHGETGDLCSNFARQKVPEILEAGISAAGGLHVIEGNFHELYCRVFEQTNSDMHKAPFDDTLSGTTAICILLHGSKLYVANVGDSRAIIARENSAGEIRSEPLSIDQTPFRKDERERLKKAGARIMTIDQIEGLEEIHENWGDQLDDEVDEIGDPPRVWDETLERPGSAFSRSLGDSVGEAVGVCSTPELMIRPLTPADKFVVIASDGVFEFLTSQSVVDIIRKFSDPLAAARQVVSEAYRLWLQYEVRTDDITIIIILFEDFETTSTPSAVVQEAAPMDMQLAANRPVRRIISKAKRRVISENWSNAEVDGFCFDDHITPKSEDELVRLEDMVKANFMFEQLSAEQKHSIFLVMEKIVVSRDDFIIREGDEGDKLYIVDNGQFQVTKKDAHGVDEVILTYKDIGATFGELSLMYGKPRAATIRAETDGTLWGIGRVAFRNIVMQKSGGLHTTKDLLDTLRGVHVFAGASFPQLQRICAMAVEERYADGKVIVDKSSLPDFQYAVCVVTSGALQLTHRSDVQETRDADHYFISNEVQGDVAEVRSSGQTILVCIPYVAWRAVMDDSQAGSTLDAHMECCRVNRPSNTFALPMKAVAKATSRREDYDFQNAVLLLDFCYVGTFRHTVSDSTFSLKVISKCKAYTSRLDERLVIESNYLTALGRECSCVPRLKTTFQDSKFLYMVYSDVYAMDLATLLTMTTVLQDAAIVHYSACILAGLIGLHTSGLMQRFVNPSAMLITTSGYVHVADLRYVKRMDGSKAFTICGDPLYFAPEVVAQTGYDFAVDFWELGVLMFELYEGKTPFGDVETVETQLFSVIAEHKKRKLSFTTRTPTNAQSVIRSLLDPNPSTRLGYADTEELKSKAHFATVDWEQLGREKPEGGFPPATDIRLDESQLLNDEEAEFQSSVFDRF